jgi:hypothetical protein
MTAAALVLGFGCSNSSSLPPAPDASAEGGPIVQPVSDAASPALADGESPTTEASAPCEADCPGCCVSGVCVEVSAAHCPTTVVPPNVCVACPAAADCRFATNAFECVPLRKVGEACTAPYQCEQEICSDGHCAAGCSSTQASCQDGVPCCNALLKCAPPPVPGASRHCCAPANTLVGANVTDCSLCCPGLTCGQGNVPGGYRCGL